MHELNTPWKGWKRKRGKSERLIYYALVGIKHAVHIAGTLIHGLEQYIFINRKSINSLHCRTFDTNFQKNMWRKYNIYCCWKRFYNGIYKMWKITCRVTIILSVKWFHFSLSFFLSLFFLIYIRSKSSCIWNSCFDKLNTEIVNISYAWILLERCPFVLFILHLNKLYKFHLW